MGYGVFNLVGVAVATDRVIRLRLSVVYKSR